MIEKNIVYNMDCVEGLKTLPDNCIDCCVTSPPYYALRDYGVDGQIGLEDSPEAYIDKLVDVFSEVFRVLKPEGTLWLNLGDSYCVTWDKGNFKDPKYPATSTKNN
jgi:DNA modification methylase